MEGAMWAEDDWKPFVSNMLFMQEAAAAGLVEWFQWPDAAAELTEILLLDAARLLLLWFMFECDVIQDELFADIAPLLVLSKPNELLFEGTDPPLPPDNETA